MVEIGSQRSRGRKDLEVAGEKLAAAATAFTVLDRMEQGFEIIIGALHEADASA